MHHLTWSDAVYFFLFCLAVFILWRVIVMLATGRMRLYGGVRARRYATQAANPRRFWINLAAYVAIVALLMWTCSSAWLELAKKIV